MATTMPAGTAAPAAIDFIDYADLYARWERGNWRATEIDFTRDREQWWSTFTEHERVRALWTYNLFFWGEDAVADNLSPYIDAAPREEQKYFLATQQVDEARHAVFFKRFMHEVCDIGTGDLASGLSAIEPELTWGFRKVFDRLDTMADELRRDRTRPKLAAAITLYHVIIEASLAQPGQHFFETYLTERDVLPGFREGIHNVSQDEQRHIAFGVKLLSELVQDDPECLDAVAELLREVTPWLAAVLTPPNWDRSYTECFGFTLEELGEHGSISFETKLRSAGISLDDLPGAAPLPRGVPARERAIRGMTLARAGVLGEKLGPPSTDIEVQRIMFDTMSRSLNREHGLRKPVAIQWDFTDAEPWYLRIDNGSTAAEHGRHSSPDLTLRSTWEDWVDVFGGRVDPRLLMAKRRLRPRGSLRLLMRFPKIFPRR